MSFTSRLPTALYTAAQVRDLDRMAIDEMGISGAELMARAGRSAFNALRARWPEARHVAVVCGTGNNGGDGFVVGRIARLAGLEVRVYLVGDAARLKGDALTAERHWADSGGETSAFTGGCLADAEVIVDALLGTGLDREVASRQREAVEAINAAPGPVLAVDIPSGLQGDTGRELGVAVRAELTVTFIGLKQGLLTGRGPDCCGTLLFDDLDVPVAVLERATPSARLAAEEAICQQLPRRVPSAHKGLFGHALIVGGDHGMAGAVLMAGTAAARVGAGLVSVATRATHAVALAAARPELMCHGVETAEDLEASMGRANVIGIGPGLGKGAWGQCMLETVLGADSKCVVDADALNLLAVRPRQRSDWVLTPHPGEAGRLLGKSAKEIQADRFGAVRQIQERYGGACVLKGAGTLVVGTDGDIVLVPRGNPGMATGGMGDVLTGVVTGLMAQGYGLSLAAQIGVWVHAVAGDLAAAAGERGLIASDLVDRLRPLVNL